MGQFFKDIIDKKRKFAKEDESLENSRSKLDFQEDIYCLTFINFLRGTTAEARRELTLKSTLTFMIQMGLIALIWGDRVGKVILGDVALNMSRIICAIILHITIVPEVRNALEMMNFAIHFPL